MVQAPSAGIAWPPLGRIQLPQFAPDIGRLSIAGFITRA